MCHAEDHPVPDEPVTVLLYPFALDSVTLSEGSGLLMLTTDAEDRLGSAREDFPDEFTVEQSVPSATGFTLLLLIAEPQAFTAAINGQVEIANDLCRTGSEW